MVHAVLLYRYVDLSMLSEMAVVSGAVSLACAKRWVSQLATSPLIKLDKSEIGLGHCVSVEMCASPMDRVASGAKYLVFHGECRAAMLLAQTKKLCVSAGFSKVVLPTEREIAYVCSTPGCRSIQLYVSEGGVRKPACRVHVTPIRHSISAPADMVLWTFVSCANKTEYSFLAPDSLGDSQSIALFFHMQNLLNGAVYYEKEMDQFPLVMGKATCGSGPGFVFGRLLDVRHSEAPSACRLLRA